MKTFGMLSILVSFLLVQSPTIDGKVQGSAKYQEAVAKGRAEALDELMKGNASIWTCGLQPSLFFEAIDRETGLYVSSFGCVVDQEILGRIAGHNVAVLESIKNHGYPKNSFKPWEGVLYDLKKAFESKATQVKPLRLVVGEPAINSPDRRYQVKLVKRPDSKDGRPVESVWVVVDGEDVASQPTSLHLLDPELLWGPEGSWFAMIRGRTEYDKRVHYMALDLRRTQTIREESHD